MKKKGPIVLIISLLIFLVFILGIRYGQKVEKTNKVIDYLISLPPSPSVQPTQAPLKFRTFKHIGCKIQFLYPSFFAKSEESSNSATLGSITSLKVDCSNQNKIKEWLDNEKVAITEVTFKGKTIKGKIKPDLRMVVGAEPYLLFSIKHPMTNKNIFVELSESLYPLFEKSLEFIN